MSDTDIFLRKKKKKEKTRICKYAFHVTSSKGIKGHFSYLMHTHMGDTNCKIEKKAIF